MHLTSPTITYWAHAVPDRDFNGTANGTSRQTYVDLSSTHTVVDDRSVLLLEMIPSADPQVTETEWTEVVVVPLAVYRDLQATLALSTADIVAQVLDIAGSLANELDLCNQYDSFHTDLLPRLVDAGLDTSKVRERPRTHEVKVTVDGDVRYVQVTMRSDEVDKLLEHMGNFEP